MVAGFKWKWEEDPSPLQIFEKGESAVTQGWKLRVDRIKEPSAMLDMLMGGTRPSKWVTASLTEKERKVLDMRRDLESDGERERRKKAESIRENAKTHPYHWKVERISNDAYPFGFMGGRATTRGAAKAFAQVAVGEANRVNKELGVSTSEDPC